MSSRSCTNVYYGHGKGHGGNRTWNYPWRSPFFFSQWSEFIIPSWSLSFLGEISTSSSLHRNDDPQVQDTGDRFLGDSGSVELSSSSPIPWGCFQPSQGCCGAWSCSLSSAGEFIQHRLGQALNPHVQPHSPWKWARIGSTTARFIAVWTAEKEHWERNLRPNILICLFLLFHCRVYNGEAKNSCRKIRGKKFHHFTTVGGNSGSKEIPVLAQGSFKWSQCWILSCPLLQGPGAQNGISGILPPKIVNVGGFLPDKSCQGQRVCLALVSPGMPLSCCQDSWAPGWPS